MTLTATPSIRKPQANMARRVDALLLNEIQFIPNPTFSLSESLSGSPDTSEDNEQSETIELPPHLRRMCQAELLTQEQESTLFRGMNLLKFQACAMRAKLDPKTATHADVAAIERRLVQAREIRDHIIQANMRLVISIVKKFVTPQQSFDEMLSDGIFVMMQAVEKFDYDRGFRFSTYAYRSIARNAYRAVTNARKEQAQITRDAEEWAFEQEGDSYSELTDRMWSNIRDVTSGMLEKLDRRERFIIRSRYALGAHRKVRTFQCLADKLGVSKERVRQLERRAIGKLQSMANGMNMDELFSAAIV